MTCGLEEQQLGIRSLVLNQWDTYSALNGGRTHE